MGARVLHILSRAAAAGGTHEDCADISEAGPLEPKGQVSRGWRWGTNSSTDVGAKSAGSFNITKIAKTQKKMTYVESKLAEFILKCSDFLLSIWKRCF